MDEQAGARTQVLTTERAELSRLRQADGSGVTARVKGKFQTNGQR